MKILNYKAEGLLMICQRPKIEVMSKLHKFVELLKPICLHMYNTVPSISELFC